MKKIVVTGGLGFIGSNFIHYMQNRSKDLTIINLDAVTYAGRPENVADLPDPERHRLVKGDIRDPETVERVLSDGVDAVVHMAAESHVDRSIRDPGAFMSANAYGTFVLLEAVRKTGIPRFVHVSTDEVYGSLGPKGCFTEESPMKPNSPYAWSKAAADLLCRAYYRTYGVPAIITRGANTYGPRQHPEKLIPLIIRNALLNKEIPIYGDGKQIRSWLYAEDHCSAIALVLEKGIPGEVYNIGDGQEYYNLYLTRRILRDLGRSEKLIRFVADRPGHDRRYAMDSAKIRCQLGWVPGYSFERGIRETVDWYVRRREELEYEAQS